MSGNIDLSSLLDNALDQYDSFGLLWRTERQQGQAGWEVQESLRSFVIECELTNKWPGTEIFYGKELYCVYRLAPGSLRILSEAEDVFSLFGEGGPEDLVFYKKGEVCFTSISHEGEAWFAT